MLSFILDIVLQAASGLLVSILIAMAMWMIDRAGLEDGDDVAGRIKYNRTLILLLAAIPLALCLTALHRCMTFFSDPYTLLMAFGLFGLAWCLLVTIKSDYDVTWTAHGITGPTSYGIWPFGPSRAFMRFADITEAGVDWAGSLYVADARGQRIRWNWCYSGHTAAAWAVERARPDLFPDDDLPDDLLT